MKAVISLGSNFEKREDYIRNALEILSERFDNIQVSTLYETPAIDGVSDPYINAVAVINIPKTAAYPITETCKMETARNLEKTFKTIEKELGRDKKKLRENIVPIDVDLVILDDLIIRPKDYNRKYFQLGYSQLKS